MFVNTSIQFRLMFLISISSVLMMGVGGLGLYGFNHSNTSLKTVYETCTVTAIQLGKILDNWSHARRDIADAIRLGNIDTAKARAEHANKLVKQNEEVWAQYLATRLTPEEERLTKIKVNRSHSMCNQ